MNQVATSAKPLLRLQVQRSDSVQPWLRARMSGQYLQCFREAEAAAGPIENWEESLTTRLQAADFLRQLGAPRRAAAMVFRLWRKNRRDPAALAAVLQELRNRGKWLTAWTLAETYSDLKSADASTAAELLAARGANFAALGDWKTAETLWAASRQRQKDANEVLPCRAASLLAAGREDEALECVADTLDEAEHHIPALIYGLEALLRQGRIEDARAMLESALSSVQSTQLTQRLVELELTTNNPQAALKALEQHREWSVLSESQNQAWIAACEQEARRLLAGPTDSMQDAPPRIRWHRPPPFYPARQPGRTETQKLADRAEHYRSRRQWRAHQALAPLLILSARQNGDWESAQAAAEKFVTIAIGTGQESAALEFLQASAINAPHAEPLLSLFQASLRLERPLEAESVAQRLLDGHRSHPKTLVTLAAWHRGRHRFADAEACLTRAKDIATEEDFAKESALLAAARGNWEAAEQHSANWLRLARENTEPLHIWLDAIAKGRGTAAAVQELGNLATKNPDLAASAAPSLLSSFPAATQKEIWSGWRAAQPHHLPLTLRYLEHLLETGQAAEALQNVTAALRRWPEHAALELLMAKALAATGRPDQAESLFQRLAMRDSRQIDAWRGWLTCTGKATKHFQILADSEEVIVKQKAGEVVGDWAQLAAGYYSPQELVLSLRKLRGALPHHWQPAAALGRALVAMKRAEEGAAELRAALAMQPTLAELWFDLAEALRLAKKEPEEIEALRQASRLRENWLPPRRRLVEIFSRNNRPAEAAEALESACQAAPDDIELSLRCAREAWEARRTDAAMARLRQLLLRHPEVPEGWDLLAEWGKFSGEPDAASKLAWEVASRRKHDLAAWLVLARVQMAERDETNLDTALEHAETIDPTDPRPHELRVEWLVSEGRHEEAAAACQPACFAPNFPKELLARAAWVEAKLGNLETASAKMREVVERFPDYHWAKQELISWHLATGKHREAATLAHSLPASAPAPGISSTPLVQKSKHTIYEMLAEFDLALREDKLDFAASLLAQLREKASGPMVLARDAQLAARNGDKQRTAEMLMAVMAAPSDDSWPLEAAIEAHQKLVGRTKLLRAMETAIDQGVANRWVMAAWVTRLNDQAWHGFPSRVSKQVPHNDGACLALCAYLEKLGIEASRRREKHFEPERRIYQACVRDIMKLHGKWLRENDAGWASMAAALCGCGLHRANLQWMRDWENRAGASDAALEKLMLSYQFLGKHSKAIEVAYHALETSRTGTTLARFHIWAAIDLALLGNLDQADQLLESAPRGTILPEDLRTAARIARILLKVSSPRFKAVFNPSAQEAFREFYQKNLPYKPSGVFSKSLRRFASSAKSLQPIAWGIWLRHGKAITTAGCIFGLILVFAFLLVWRFGSKLRKLYPWLPI